MINKKILITSLGLLLGNNVFSTPAAVRIARLEVNNAKLNVGLINQLTPNEEVIRILRRVILLLGNALDEDLSYEERNQLKLLIETDVASRIRHDEVFENIINELLAV